jgi:hypothetical protein
LLLAFDKFSNQKLKIMKNKEQYRYYLQVKFRNNGDPHWFRTWDINEPFKSLSDCKRMAEGMLDDTVEKMRISDAVKNDIYKQYR